MPTNDKYNYFNAFRWIYSRLESRRKKQFWILFAGMALSACLETVAVGSLALFASALTDPDNVSNSKYVRFAIEILNIDFPVTAKSLILASGFIMIFIVIFKNSVKITVSYWVARFGVGIEAYFGKKMLQGFLTLPYKWHQTKNTADLILAINWRVHMGRNFFQPCLIVFNNILMVSVMLTALFIVQPLVSLILLGSIGGNAVLIFKIIKIKIDRAVTKARDYQLIINKETTKAIHGIKDVKISLTETLFVSKFYEQASLLSRIIGAQNFFSEAPTLILETIGLGMIFLSILVMLTLFNASIASVTGTMAILAVTAWKALPAANQVLRSVTQIRTALPFISTLTDYFTLIESKTKTELPKTIQPFKFKRSIKFNNVSFSYDDSGKEVIHDATFEIKKGETVGVIGTSGAGKSTLIDLLIGLLIPVKGTITLDERILIHELLPSWLKITGYVPQAPYIYDGSLAENVAFGMNNAAIDKDRVLECCTMASMDDFLHDLPESIESFIGERGVKLSGGQQQRVAIARALYNKPEVMIFDEATSSLDTKSEKTIQETIYSFKGNQTLVIIAHRLSTVEDCDKLIWLEKGCVRQIGTPGEILPAYKHQMKKENC
jgi:ATP-binding cassette, subfamily B, bacterial PglK